MPATRLSLLFALLAGGAIMPHAKAAPMKITDLLTSGLRPVRLVGFGDSITGVYYHTGGRRAWPEMLGLALQRLCPQAKLEIINAGLSGGNTASGLARMDKDVLACQPDLVVVMFGMNDVVANASDVYETNLRTIVAKSRAAGAEVVLCTPNWVLPNNGSRDLSKLTAYADLVRQVAADLALPMADCFAAYETVHARNPRDFTLFMSDGIHPNMRGHKLFAETIAETITARRVSLDDIGPLPGLPHVKRKLDAGQPLCVLAMPPYDTLIEPAVRALYPQAHLQVMRWEVAGQSLAQIEQAAQAQGWWHFREHSGDPRPNLVVIAVPADAAAPDFDRSYRSYTWILNWSLSFGVSEWDCFAVTPSVAQPDLPEAQRPAEELAETVITGQDLPYLTRLPGQNESAAALLRSWLRHQLGH